MIVVFLLISAVVGLMYAVHRQSINAIQSKAVGLQRQVESLRADQIKMAELREHRRMTTPRMAYERNIVLLHPKRCSAELKSTVADIAMSDEERMSVCQSPDDAFNIGYCERMGNIVHAFGWDAERLNEWRMVDYPGSHHKIIAWQSAEAFADYLEKRGTDVQ